MKKFKQFITEVLDVDNSAGLSSSPIPHNIDDADIKLKVNAILGHTAVAEFMNPRAAVAQMEAKLALLGLNRVDNEPIEFSEEGEFDLVFNRYGEIIGKSVDTPFDEIEKEEKQFSLRVKYEQLDSGSFKVYGNLN